MPNELPPQHSEDPIIRSAGKTRRVLASLQDALNTEPKRFFATLALDGAVWLAGGTILWLNAGQSVADPTVLGTFLFTVITATLLSFRRAVVTVPAAKQTDASAESWTLTEKLVSLRDLALLLIAALGPYLGSYFQQWLITYMAVILTVSAAGPILTGLLTSRTRHSMLCSAITLLVGIISLVLTQQVHQNNFMMLGFIAVLFLISVLTARIVTYWFTIVIGTIPEEPGGTAALH